MPITKEKKEKIVSDLTDKFKKGRVEVLTDYSGLSVADITDLRKKAREKGIDYKIAKNTLFKIAAKNAGISDDENAFNQPIAIAFGYGDEVDTPKVLKEFSDSNENLQIIGGIIEGNYVSREKILQLANLPSREELYAKIVGSLSSPLRGLLSVIQGNLRGLVFVLNQYKEKVEKV